jgi:hypothetical protein
MADPITLTDAEIDALVAKLGKNVGLVFDTEPIEVY